MSLPINDLGGGLSNAVVKSPGAGELQHGKTSQITRALAMGSYFLVGTLAINLSQVVGTPLYLINKDWYNTWVAFTKQSFGLLITTMTQYWAPTTIRISGDKSMRGQLLKTAQGNLYCDFPERLVFIANHQIYTDWLYIWWLAYTAGMHGRIYIVLKETLRRIPIIGWGMQFNKFIFLKRNWEKDRPNLARHLSQLNKPKEPMWLTLFPEGTNLAPSTRKASAKWAAKNGLQDMRHQLLPRTTGLQFILQELRQTTAWIYDCTIAYEGVPRGQYAQDIFTLRAFYVGGRGPKSINFHFRRFKLSSIPLDDHDAFSQWLLARWTEKDNLLEYYQQNGHFPADSGSEQLPDGSTKRGCGHLETTIRVNKWYEFIQAFAPVGLLSMILYTFYGALPKQMVNWLQRQSIQNKIDMVKTIGLQQLGKINEQHLTAPTTINSHQLAILKKAMVAKNITINQETIQKALDAGFFKPKNGVSTKKSKPLAITNQSVGQAVAVTAATTHPKPGLTAPEKRARARNRQAQQQVQTSTSVPAQTSQPSARQQRQHPKGAVHPMKAPISNKNITANPAISAAQNVRKPQTGVQPKSNAPLQPKPSTHNTPTKNSVTLQKPQATNSTSVPSKANGITPVKPATANATQTIPAKKALPLKKLPPRPIQASASTTDDAWSTTTGTTATGTNKSAPRKLEVRSSQPPSNNRPPPPRSQAQPPQQRLQPPSAPQQKQPASNPRPNTQLPTTTSSNQQAPSQPKANGLSTQTPAPVKKAPPQAPTGPKSTTTPAASLNKLNTVTPATMNGTAKPHPTPIRQPAPLQTASKNAATNNGPTATTTAAGPPKLPPKKLVPRPPPQQQQQQQKLAVAATAPPKLGPPQAAQKPAATKTTTAGPPKLGPPPQAVPKQPPPPPPPQKVG